MRLRLTILFALLGGLLPAATVYWPGNYGAGDLVVFTNTQTTTFYITNSGTAGSPITFSNGTFKAATWPYTNNLNPGGAINLNGQSHLVIKSMWIEATNNGTLLGNRVGTAGIYGYSMGTDLEIAGCVITNLFRKVVLASPNATNLQPDISPIFLHFNDATNISVHNNVIVHGGNGITFNYGGSCTNVSAVSNVISDVSFGIFINCNSAGNSSGFRVANNVCSNLSTYDGDWGSGSGDHNHNNFLIVNSTSATATNPRLRVEGNWAGGACGVYMTSLIKITPDYNTFTDPQVVNNILVNNDPAAVISNGMISISANSGALVANNTLVNLPGLSCAATGMKFAGTSGTLIFNNVFFQSTMNVISDGGVAGSDYNAVNQFNPGLGDSAFYGQSYLTTLTIGFSTGLVMSFGVPDGGRIIPGQQVLGTGISGNVRVDTVSGNTVFLHTYSGGWTPGFNATTNSSGLYTFVNTYLTYYDWTNSTYYDNHSLYWFTNFPYLQTNTQNFTLITGSQLIGGGTNLTIWGITTDFNGNTRPASGAWTIGAFEAVTGGDSGGGVAGTNSANAGTGGRRYFRFTRPPT